MLKGARGMDQNRGRTGTIVLIAILFFTFLIVLILSMAKTGDARKRSEVEKACAVLAERDIHLYVIGTLPEAMSFPEDKVDVIAPENISEDTMPVPWSRYPTEVRDPEGNLVETIPPRIYAEHMLILVNGVSDGLTDEALETIRQCVVSNHVPVLLIGEYPVKAFKRTLLMTTAGTGEFDSMYYSVLTGGISCPIDPDHVEKGGKNLTLDIIGFWEERIDDPASQERINEVITPPAQTAEAAPDGKETEESVNVTGSDDSAAAAASDPVVGQTIPEGLLNAAGGVDQAGSGEPAGGADAAGGAGSEDPAGGAGEGEGERVTAFAGEEDNNRTENAA